MSKSGHQTLHPRRKTTDTQLLGLLLFQVIWVLIHRDGTYATWRTPFHQLAEGNTPADGGINMSQKRSEGVATTPAPAPAPVQETA